MSYFATPNFIVYDEWFDDLKKEELDIKEQKIKTISKIHDFFYKQSDYKVGASENILQLDIKVNQKELFNNNLKNTSEKYSSISNKKFWFFKKPTKRKIKFNVTKKIICSFLIFGFLLFFGCYVFFISTSRKSEPNIPKQFFSIEK